MRTVISQRTTGLFSMRSSCSGGQQAINFAPRC